MKKNQKNYDSGAEFPPDRERQPTVRKSEKIVAVKPKRGKPAVVTRVFSWLFALVLLALSAGVCYLLLRYGVFPQFHRSIVIGVIVLVNLIVWILLIAGQSKKARVRTAIALSLVFSIIMGAFGYYLYFGVNALDAINENKNLRSTSLSLVVMTDSPYQAPADVIDKTIHAPLRTDSEVIDAYATSLNSRFNIQLPFTNVSSYHEAVDNLYSGGCEAIVFKNAMLSNVLDTHPNFSTETRVIDEWSIEKKVQDVAKPVDTSKKGFNVYISGIDTYGPISSVSNSDVNIIMTINPDSNQLLLTSVPRDTYLPIAGGGGGHNDKLTHAGIYGVESSIQTLEDFLDIDINYYARVNFTSLITIVDQIGGIDVENPVSFNTDYYNFPAGTVHMNGEQALAFSRERHNLAGGDFDRGRNQERVILAIFKQINQPEFLLNYRDVLNSVEGSVQTNMPTEDMVKLVNQMIVDRSPWTTEMIDVKGTGKPGLNSYLIPGREIYMMEAYPDSVAEVKDKILKTLQGPTE
ncbi:MAG: LCP family protein [Fastidiosipilaceae bacterium]|jgi:LCP family protein required for cell wall assembly